MAVLISIGLVAIAIGGCVYTLAAAYAVRVFARRPLASQPSTAPDITVLKPLHGAEAGLYENLATFMQQDYEGAVQCVFGVVDEHDLAIPVVHRLARAYPDRDIEIVVGPRPVGVNGKIANLVAMSAFIKHDVVMMSDSDIRVSPSYLRHIAAVLEEADVGLVTCLYRGGIDDCGGGLWSRLSTMAIDFQFFPSVLLGLRLGKARPCMGATMAMTTRTLAAIGGFKAFSSHLADDYAIGEAVRAIGQRVVVAAEVVVHQCNEQSAADLFLHELRWARTIRSIDPLGYAGSLITHPVPFALLAFFAALAGGAPAMALPCVAASLGCRLWLQREVELAMGISTLRWLLGPVRDLVGFAVFVASFAANAVVWRGQRFRIKPDGTMMQAEIDHPEAAQGNGGLADSQPTAGRPA